MSFACPGVSHIGGKMPNLNYFLKLNLNEQTIPYSLNLPITTIGCSTEAQISLPYGKIDSRHCRIEKRNNKDYMIRDLRSSTGTYVNGARIIEALLNPGDRIKISDFLFEFTNDEVSYQVKPPSRVLKNFFKSSNPKWKQILESIPNMARSPYPVLILGPSGTGKELTAQAIHENSDRAEGPFICVNCCALAENLIESELFGHTKGSFTGAISERKGAFETARGGTLFLDEIGDLSYNLQAKLLRALENREIRAVGSDRVIKTDVRVISATHQNLFEKLSANTFRSDLFYRINVITITTPSLFDRMEDFEDIFFNLCKEARVRFTFDAVRLLKSHNWPGNIRELKNVVSRASALYGKRAIEESMIHGLIDFNSKDSKTFPETSLIMSKKANLVKEMEKNMILTRLRANKGNQRKTAIELGIPKSTLNDRVREYKKDLEKFKESIDES
jgi:transcriptional regulator with PAS, ATPase and Fis domain